MQSSNWLTQIVTSPRLPVGKSIAHWIVNCALLNVAYVEGRLEQLVSGVQAVLVNVGVLGLGDGERRFVDI